MKQKKQNYIIKRLDLTKQRMTSKEIIEQTFTLKIKKSLNIINGIYKRSKTNNSGKKFDKLYSLLYNKNLLIQALGNIEKNKGRLTPGIDRKTVDSINLKKIEKISFKIKNNLYKWKAVKRIYVEKPKLLKKGEKKKMRPIGIPTFEDRIVQETIRIILEAIYEPEFDRQDSNWGFRPKKSTVSLIENLRFKCSGCNFAVEGDIDGAYNNVNHNILIKILSEKIKDTKFLKFLKLGFKAGLLDQGKFEHSLLGVPQGGIVSPILFNIYMDKFDKYVLNELKNEIDINFNKKENRSFRPRNKEYSQLTTQISLNRRRLIKIQGGKKWINLTESEKNKALEIRKNIKYYSFLRFKTPSYLISKREIKINYYRYADDFIIINNGNKKHNLFIKNLITIWLENNLELKISQEKTKITTLIAEPAKFLGFSIQTYRHYKLSLSKYGDFTKKAGWNIIINIDIQRLIDRLIIKKFIHKKNNKYLPIAKTPWIVLRPEEIITKFNSIIRGLLVYYIPVIDRTHQINSILYFLKFSCLCTLARKYDKSIIKLRELYGDPLTITISEKIIKQYSIKETEKTFTLITYKYARETGIIDKIKSDYNKRTHQENQFNNGDIFNIMKKINWRTYRNLTNQCSICGTTEDVQMHHVKHIKKGKVIGFTQVLKQLNRRMIPLCSKHHRDVHNGKYDNIKLNDLYDIERFLY